MSLRDEGSYWRAQLAHPTPWRYKSGVIYDADDKIVAEESKMSSVIFDLIWATYFDVLRES